MKNEMKNIKIFHENSLKISTFSEVMFIAIHDINVTHEYDGHESVH